MTAPELERSVRHRLDNWKFWVAIAYLGLAATVVGLFFINQSTQNTVAKQAKDEAIHAAEIASNAKAQYTQCLTSSPLLEKINDFIDGVRIVEHSLILNSRANLGSTNKKDPQYKVRQANLNRLVRASKVADSVDFPVPTKAQCKERRDQLLKEQ